MIKRKLKSKQLKNQFDDIDYWDKLSEEEREWMRQFLFEYYQGDFRFENPIHTKDEHRKEAYVRNNAMKRTWEAVGFEKKIEAAAAARRAQSIPLLKNKFYTPEDIFKDVETVDNEPADLIPETPPGRDQ